jgi:hypothetical protein
MSTRIGVVGEALFGMEGLYLDSAEIMPPSCRRMLPALRRA